MRAKHINRYMISNPSNESREVYYSHTEPEHHYALVLLRYDL
jgi:hypothetical protein